MSDQMSSVFEYVRANLPALASDVSVILGSRAAAPGVGVEVAHLEELANMLYPKHQDAFRAAQDLVVSFSLRQLATGSGAGKVYKQQNIYVCTHLDMKKEQ